MKYGMIAAAVLCASAAARADIVYQNSTGVVDNGHPVTNWQLAEDFQVSAPAVITGAQVPILELFGGSFGPGNLANWDGSLQWSIYLSDGMASGPNTQGPGTLLASGAGVNIQTTQTSATSNRGYYLFDFEFGQTIPIAANTRYWFGLHLNQDYDNAWLFWQQADTSTMERLVGRQNGVGNYGFQGAHDAFSLVPAPGSAVLLALGGFALRRKRRG